MKKLCLGVMKWLAQGYAASRGKGRYLGHTVGERSDLLFIGIRGACLWHSSEPLGKEKASPNQGMAVAQG